MVDGPYLQRVWLRPDAEVDPDSFPGNLPFVRNLDLTFKHPVTFFVGENGSGKSSLIEAIAEICGLPVGGGGRNEAADVHAPHRSSELAPLLRASFRRKPRDGYFFRAEFQAHFASALDARAADPSFRANPYERYGGQSLHQRSHGEAFLAVLNAWMNPGVLVLDEPEAALSPQRQLVLLAQIAKLARTGTVQFVVATHSPILLTYPGATLLSLDDGDIHETRLEDTAHYQITKGMLTMPERYWRELLRDD